MFILKKLCLIIFNQNINMENKFELLYCKRNLLFILITLIFYSCSNSEDTPTDPIVGLWVYEKNIINNEEIIRQCYQDQRFQIFNDRKVIFDSRVLYIDGSCGNKIVFDKGTWKTVEGHDGHEYYHLKGSSTTNDNVIYNYSYTFIEDGKLILSSYGREEMDIQFREYYIKVN